MHTRQHMMYAGLFLCVTAGLLTASCHRNSERADQREAMASSSAEEKEETEGSSQKPSPPAESPGMFQDATDQLATNPSQKNYGVAVTDINDDGAFEFVVAGFGNPNLAYAWDGDGYTQMMPPVVDDPMRDAIGVAACDVDADGREELYVLNTDSYSGQKEFGDRLFDAVEGGWINLFEMEKNQDALNLTAGRSVACVDRMGNGRYGVFVANYGGPMRLYEVGEDDILTDVAASAGVDRTTGGRGIVAGPILTDKIDLFLANERGPNFLFKNNGDGTFAEVAAEASILDARQNGRGIDLLDGNGDGRFDIVYGNWEGPHRLYIQQEDGTFVDQAPEAMAVPSPIRTVIAADFDNDGYEEIFFNNIGAPNRLFRQKDGAWVEAETGDALETTGLGTGGAVADLDGDGRLELLLAHGESGAQPLTLYKTAPNDNHWLRILPRTEQGAPARGALVEVEAAGRTQRRVIDSGSGYLCQMEPVAHIGLGEATDVTSVRVRWPDGAETTLTPDEVDTTIEVAHP